MDNSQEIDQKQLEKFPNFDHVLKTTDGWLSPKGVFLICKSDEHSESASFIVNGSDEFRQLVDAKKIKFAEKDADRFRVEKLGYVLILIMYYMRPALQN